ncbi:hypothetical protein [Dyella monticola]|uniref:hypothetical protein n=1 Tax=Dyella monticola TaxID=1927958 RepID=UPI0011C01A1B|nr:hypothetical protein [Dyella monticola]
MKKSTELYRLRRRLALRGRYYKKPLLLANIVFILLSYSSYVFFAFASHINVMRHISHMGERWIPIVDSAASYAVNPDLCKFVMSIQWLSLFFYAYIFFVIYCPASILTRVTMHKWYANNDVPNKKLGGTIFFIFSIGYILGELRFITFPTFFNGELFSVGAHLNYLSGIINSPLAFPFFAWFCPFVSVAIYWAIFNFACNFRNIFDLRKK